jgi:hypothetical protein
MDHVIRRISQFPKRSWADPENPTLGIDDDSMLRYIKDNDDEKLEQGLAALDQDVSALRKSPAVVLEKLDKGTVRSRRAVAKFLSQTKGLEPFEKPQVGQALQDRANKESDPEAKQALNSALLRIRAAREAGSHD